MPSPRGLDPPWPRDSPRAPPGPALGLPPAGAGAMPASHQHAVPPRVSRWPSASASALRPREPKASGRRREAPDPTLTSPPLRPPRAPSPGRQPAAAPSPVATPEPGAAPPRSAQHPGRPFIRRPRISGLVLAHRQGNAGGRSVPSPRAPAGTASPSARRAGRPPRPPLGPTSPPPRALGPARPGAGLPSLRAQPRAGASAPSSPPARGLTRPPRSAREEGAGAAP